LTRGLRAGLLVVVAAAAAGTAGCSLLIGVSGDPMVFDDDGAVEGGDEADSAIAQDAAPAADGPGE
jgi:hypothetical protein